MKRIIKSIMPAFLLAAVSIGVASCDEDGINGYAPVRPIGGYNSSSEIAPDNLVAFWSFNGGVSDSVENLAGNAVNTTFAAGRKGQALKGSANGYVVYENAGTRLPALQSFTASMWINTQKHDGGAQCVFMLPKTSDFWGNMFMLIEGNNTPADSMLIKINFAGQWAELTGTNRVANMYGSWKHVAFSYNATTSKFFMYINGIKLTLPATITDRKAGTNPLGPLAFTDVSKFVIGGYQQHAGAPWSAPDGWMLNYTGLLDEFRIYNNALSDTEINALYKLEALGR